jgi:RNA polymerase sigma-70 factor (ECF subfamily)
VKTLNSEKERRLVKEAKNGNISAFREIVQEYQNKIFYLSLDFTGNREDAEDVLQEVLMKAYRSISKFKGEASIGTWLHRIAVNTCLDRKRVMTKVRYAFNEQGEEREFEPPELRPVGNPEKLTESGKILEHIERATRRLAPLEKSVFILRHYHQYSTREVAEMLDRSEGTIKNVLFRSLKKLQKELSFYREEIGIGEIR